MLDLYKERKEREEKCKENMKMCANGILIIAYLATFILIIIWLFKLLCNAKNEPTNRIRYINKDPANYYTEGEFCFDNCEKFIINGALDTFGIPLKKIKKYTRALLGTIFISIGSIVFILIFAIIENKAYRHEDLAMSCGILFYLIFLLSVILSIVFAIVLAHYYFKGKYSDFEEFSRCRFLTKRFRTDYDFIYKIKNEFKMPFVIILLSEFFNFINILNDSSRNKI